MDTQKVEKMVKMFVAFSDEEKKVLAVLAGMTLRLIGSSGGIQEFIRNLNHCIGLPRKAFAELQLDGPFFTEDTYIDMDYEGFYRFVISQELLVWKEGFTDVSEQEADVIMIVIYFSVSAKIVGEKSAKQEILEHFEAERLKHKDLDEMLRAVTPLI